MLNPEEINFYINQFKGLELTDVFELFKLSQTRKLAAGEVYIAEGSNYQKLAYIKKGLIRSYLLKENGDEITLMIRWENQFLASHDSIIHQRPSRFTYQALENTVLMEIDYHKAQPIIDHSSKLSKTRNNLLLQMLSDSMYRVENFILLSAEERYLKLVQEKPDIINRVPDKYLATMLGITPVSLSRIRKRIASSPKH